MQHLLLLSALLAAFPSAAGDYNTERQVDDVAGACALYGVWQGRVCKAVDVFAHRDLGWSSTSVQGDACQYLDTTQANANAVSSATAYFLRSSSDNDIAGGTGARTVSIVTLDALGFEQTTTVNLDGGQTVSLGAGFSAIQWMEVASVGSGGVAAGNITISLDAGSAAAPVVGETVEKIAAGDNRSMCGRYTVPAGYTAYVLGWDATSTSSATMDARLRATVMSNVNGTASTVLHPQDQRFVLGTSSSGPMAVHWLKLPAGTVVKLSAIPSAAAAANRLDARFHLLLVAN